MTIPLEREKRNIFQKVVYWMDLPSARESPGYVSKTANIFQQFISIAERIQLAGAPRILHGVGLLSAVLAPIAFLIFCKAAVQFVFVNNLRTKVDAAMDMLSTSGTLLVITAQVTLTLDIMKWVAMSSMTWAGQVTMVGGVFSGLFFVFLGSVGWFRSQKLLDQMDEDIGNGRRQVSDYRKAFDGIMAMDNLYLMRVTEVSDVHHLKNTFKLAMDRAEESGDKREVEAMFEALKGKIKSKIWSDRLMIVVGWINVLAAVTLLVTMGTPLAPLGYALIAVAAIGSLAMVVNNEVSRYRFDHTIDSYDPVMKRIHAETPWYLKIPKWYWRRLTHWENEAPELQPGGARVPLHTRNVTLVTA